MYAEYYAGDAWDLRNEDWELAITFEPTEEWEYTAYITGLPTLEWKEQNKSWELEVRSEVPREEIRRISTKAPGSRKHIY
jgi:hypothetical protein